MHQPVVWIRLPRLGHGLRAGALVTVALATTLSPAGAQEVRGRVIVEGSPDQPVEGALATLIAETDIASDTSGSVAAGETVDAAFTSASGALALAAPLSGAYRVRIERIGFETWTSESYDLRPGEVALVQFEVPILPVRLAELDVSIYRGCEVDPRRAEQLYAVWDEARKALEAALLTQRQQLLLFDIVTFDRIPLGRTLEFTNITTAAGKGTIESPFESVPAEDLSRDGYIQDEGETIYFYAPDAEVLLSDTFLTDHCFGLDRDEVDGRRLVGLTFEPVEDRQTPDIEGVLWLDEETAELDHVEFEYREIPYRGVDTDEIGGRIEFHRLPSGAFVVGDWIIRMPAIIQTERDVRRDRYTLAGFTEHGGELRKVFTPDGVEIDWRRGGVITGTIIDPLSGQPLANATVRLDRPRGPDVARHTGPEGGFAFDDLGPGRHKLRLTHPMLDVIEWDDPRAEAELGEGEVVDLSFPLPQPEEVLDEFCDSDARGGLLIGRIWDDLGFPQRGVTVWAEWNERTGRERPDGPAAGPRRRLDEVRTNRAGRYRLCDLPLDAVVDVYVAAPAELETRRITTGRQVSWLDFVVDRP